MTTIILSSNKFSDYNFMDSGSEDLLGRLADQARGHAVILLDIEGAVIGWLAGAEKVFGYAKAEIIGKYFGILFTAEDVKQGIPELELNIAREGTEAEDDRWMVRKDGLSFWATGINTALKDETGKLVGYGKVLRNRTDLKGQIESIESQLDVEKCASERKNTFVVTLAHEFRNPLSSAMNALQLTERRGLTDETLAFARSVIHRQLDSINQMIEGLLEVTKLGTGKIILHKEKISLNHCVAAALETLHVSIEEKKHRVHVLAPSAEIFINADPLGQVFSNLIHNSCKYTPPGGNIWIKIYAEGEDAYARFEDDGIGISAEILPHIFDLFAQAQSRSNNHNSGLGIGLSLVKETISLHGGTVMVRSDGQGKGSQFILSLPLCEP